MNYTNLDNIIDIYLTITQQIILLFRLLPSGGTFTGAVTGDSSVDVRVATTCVPTGADDFGGVATGESDGAVLGFGDTVQQYIS